MNGYRCIDTFQILMKWNIIKSFLCFVFETEIYIAFTYVKCFLKNAVFEYNLCTIITGGSGMLEKRLYIYMC